jgi:adenylosuccinate synthase
LPDLIVIDSVRIASQVDAFRSAFGSKVVHIHLVASDASLKKRFSRRKSALLSGEAGTYAKAKESKTEQLVDELADKADIVINTERNTPSDVLTRASARLGLLSRGPGQLVDVLVGGQYGSEGKGNIVSYLAPEYDVLLRVGSVNAGHKVYLDPIQTFRQLPSGTLHNHGALIVLGPGTQIRLAVLQKEIRQCEIPVERLKIDPNAMIIEDSDAEAEDELKKRIGSTGQGVGRAASRRVLRGNDVRLAANVPELKPYLRPTVDVLEAGYKRGWKFLLEGTQGTSLSIFHGHYPHVTSRDTTVSGCLSEAGIHPRALRRVLMVCRTFPIRVMSPSAGDSGPMQQEISWRVIAKRSGIRVSELLQAEKGSVSNNLRRVGEFDWEQLRKSSILNGPTDIALTFVDHLDVRNRRARRYERLTEDTINFVEEVERVSGAPVSLISTRFHWRSIIDRRHWG